MRRAVIAAGAAAAIVACGHNDAELRTEHAQARQYRDAWESQATEIAALKARVADLEKRAASCQSPASQEAH